MSDANFLEQLHPEHEKCPFVTVTTCAIRTRASKWIVAALLGLMSVFVALVVYASGQASSANERYTDMGKQLHSHQQEITSSVQIIKSEFNTYRAEKRVFDNSVIEKLDEVKAELSEQRKEQRLLLDKILQLQIDLARRAGVLPE